MNTTAPLQAAPNWRKGLLSLGLLLIWLFFWYRDTAVAMVNIWSRADTYAHGYIVPLISLWLIWRQRASLLQLTPRPGLLAWPLMAGIAVLWLLGDLVAVNAATQFALVAMIVLAVPAVLGWQVTSALMFPLAFLFFAVPIGDFMMPKLMEWTADFTVLALRASGIPVYREGQQFVIPSGNWSVVEACSGIRYLIASVTVGSLFAYLNYQTTLRRLVFVGVSLLVPIVANWLRAYIIVMLGHYSGNTIATGVDHLVYGWLFFGVVIMIMFLIGARWTQPAVELATGGVSQATVPGARGGLLNPFAVPLAALAMGALLAFPHAVNFSLQQSRSALVPVLGVVSPQGAWRAGQQPLADWKPAFSNPSVASQTSFVDQKGSEAGLYIGYYRNQNYQHKLVTSENVLVTSTDKLWAQVGGGASGVQFGVPVTVRTAELRRQQPDPSGSDPRLVVWQLYWVNGRVTASDAMAKIHGAWGRLMGQGDDGAVIVLYTPKQTPPGVGDASAVLQAFVDAHADTIIAVLQQTRSQR